MKHLLLEIVEATEAAALAASKYIGSGDKLQIDKVATDAMRKRLNQISMNGKVVIGEGLKDGSFGLYKGEWVGKNQSDPHWKHDNHEYDIAVDPVDGTSQVANGGYEAMSVIAVGGFESLLATDIYRMNKIAVGKKIADTFLPDIQAPIEKTVKSICDVLGKSQITVCLLDRPRHAEIVHRLRACNCCIKQINDCDISAAIATALPESGIDLFVGIGGAPEGVLAAAAIKCLGGYFEGQLVDNQTNLPISSTYSHDGLAKGDVMFVATGITNGTLLKGVRIENNKGVITNSILMESYSKSLKRVESYYEL